MRFPQRLRRLVAATCVALLLPAAAMAETILRYTDHEPLGGMRTRFIKDVFFAAVEKETNGRLKIRDQWDSSVATGYDALRTIGTSSAADIGIVVPEYTDKDLPLHQIFKGFPAGPAGQQQVTFFRRVFAEIPEFAAELKKNNVVNIFIATGYPVAFFSPKPLKNLEEIKADTWRTASFWHRDFLRNAGASPVSIPWGVGVFNALKAGTLNGLMVNIDSGHMLKVHEVAPHVLASRELWLGHVYLLAMNAGVWERLAQEDKDAIGRAADTAYRTLGGVMDSSFDAMVKDMTAEGAKIRLLETSEVLAFAKATRFEEVQATWAKAEEAKGQRGAGEMIEKVRALLRDSVK